MGVSLENDFLNNEIEIINLTDLPNKDYLVTASIHGSDVYVVNVNNCDIGEFEAESIVEDLSGLFSTYGSVSESKLGFAFGFKDSDMLRRLGVYDTYMKNTIINSLHSLPGCEESEESDFKLIDTIRSSLYVPHLLENYLHKVVVGKEKELDGVTPSAIFDYRINKTYILRLYCHIEKIISLGIEEPQDEKFKILNKYDNRFKEDQYVVLNTMD